MKLSVIIYYLYNVFLGEFKMKLVYELLEYNLWLEFYKFFCLC